MADKKIDGSLEVTGKFNPNGSGYGLTLPDTSSISSDKVIATQDGVTSVVQTAIESIKIEIVDLTALS